MMQTLIKVAIMELSQSPEGVFILKIVGYFVACLCIYMFFIFVLHKVHEFIAWYCKKFISLTCPNPDWLKEQTALLSSGSIVHKAGVTLKIKQRVLIWWHLGGYWWFALFFLVGAVLGCFWLSATVCGVMIGFCGGFIVF